MIRRRDQHGLVLIPQMEVARLAGALARQLGGEIEPPQQREAMVRAAEISQRGWEELDDAVTLDSHRLPCEAEDLPRLAQIAAWERTTRAAWEEGPLASGSNPAPSLGGNGGGSAGEETRGRRAAALVSILALQWMARPALHRNESRRENFAFNQLQHLEVERLEGVRPWLELRQEVPTRHGLPETGADLPGGQLTRSERELVRQVRVLEVVLEIAREACGHTVVERTLGVMARSWDVPEMLVRAKWGQGETLQVSPWCLAPPRLEFDVRARCIAPRRYRDEADLRQALAAASELTMTIELIKGGG